MAQCVTRGGAKESEGGESGRVGERDWVAGSGAQLLAIRSWPRVRRCDN